MDDLSFITASEDCTSKIVYLQNNKLNNQSLQSKQTYSCSGMFAEESDKINDITIDNQGNIQLATLSGFVHKFDHKLKEENKFETNYFEPSIS